MGFDTPVVYTLTDVYLIGKEIYLSKLTRKYTA